MIPILVPFFLLFASFLWGIEPVLQKMAMTNIQSETFYLLSALPLTIAWILFVLFNYKKLRHDLRENKAFTLRNVVFVGAIVIFFSALPQFIYLKMLKKHPSTVVAAITSTFPLFTLIVAKMILKEPIVWEEVLGIILITLGVITISLKTPDLSRTA